MTSHKVVGMSTSKPTILHVIDTTGPGGAETVFLDLAEHMNVVGYNKLAIIKGPGWVQQQLEKRNIPFLVLEPHGCLSIPYYLKLIRILKQYNVAYIQAHLLGSALTYSILRLFHKAPVVATLHGQVDVNPNEKFIGIKRSLLKVGVNRVVAVSDQLAGYLSGQGLFHKNQISVIHNGVNLPRYSGTPSDTLRNRLKLPGNVKFAGSVGNIRPAKDYATLVRAAKYVIDKHRDVHFVIAGHSKQPLQGELDALVRECNLEGHVHFLGFVEDIPDFLKQLDVFVLSSSTEGFSIATIEAMASKIPVVATRCGGPEEILSHGLTGMLVPKCDAKALEKAISEVLSGNVKTKEMAYSVVSERFSLSTQLKQYLNIIKDELNIDNIELLADKK